MKLEVQLGLNDGSAGGITVQVLKEIIQKLHKQRRFPHSRPLKKYTWLKNTNAVLTF
jgi:hypothetical protein